MPCAVCLRASKGFGFLPHLIKKPGVDAWFCSLEHMEMYKMTDFTKHEDDMIWRAAQSAGEYLVEICKTDFASMSREEKMQFLRSFVSAYSMMRVDQGTQLPLNDEIPF